MKTKVLGISIVCIILFVSIQFSDFEVFSQVNQHIKEGNDFFIIDDFEEASSEFLDGLVLTSLKEKPFKELDNQLNTNLGMTSYVREQYLEANEYFDKTSGNYLLRGDGYYYLGELEQDPKLKLGQYSKALDIFKEGIIEKPRDLDLKFNYEFVLDKLNQEKQDQENQDKGNQDKENQDQESQDQENQNQESQDQESQDQENQNQESQDQESQAQENQNQESQDQESQDQKRTKTKRTKIKKAKKVKRVKKVNYQKSLMKSCLKYWTY